MLCLGIETSCDETALAFVEDGLLKASVLASQTDVHALFGGVVPELASREHSRLIGPLYDSLLRGSDIDPRRIGVVAFARGPGLLGSLLVGAGFAKALALGYTEAAEVPPILLGVNHLHAHLLAAGLEGPLVFPALGLLVSGGHTHIYRIESPKAFICLGRSIDDAAGEAFDKIGKLLGLPYPAGRRMDELGRTGTPDPDMFPLPYLNNDNLDFSFSGLKTAAATRIRNARPLSEQAVGDLCASLNMAVAQTLRRKFERALMREQGVRSLVLAGGVAANSVVRAAFADMAAAHALPLALPSPALCTDNGAMIAYMGCLLARDGWRHDFDVSCIPRGMPVPDDLIRRLDSALPHV